MDIENLKKNGARPELIRVAEYCKHLAGSRVMPRLRQLSLTDMLWVLEHIFLVDVLRDEDDYRFSLFGNHVRKIYGTDFSGKLLSSVNNANSRNLFRATYNAVVATQTALYLRGKYCWPTQEIDVERLLIPLADDNGHLSTILGVLYADIPEEALTQYPENGPAFFIPSNAGGYGTAPTPAGKADAPSTAPRD